MESEPYISNNDIFKIVNKLVVKRRDQLVALIGEDLFEAIYAMLHEYKDVIIPAVKRDILQRLDDYVATIRLENVETYSVSQIEPFKFGDTKDLRLHISKPETNIVSIDGYVQHKLYHADFSTKHDADLQKLYPSYQRAMKKILKCLQRETSHKMASN